MKRIKFFTKEEIDIITDMIVKGEEKEKIVNRCSKKFKRTPAAIGQKYQVIKSSLGLSRQTGRKTKMQKVEELKSVVLPKNIALEFEASRVILKENHVIIYFKS